MRSEAANRSSLMLRSLFLSALFLSANASGDLIATFSQDGKSDSRIDRLPALNIDVGQPATPFVDAGPFEAKWTGKLVVSRRQRLAFSFEGTGSAKLLIAGKEVLVREGELAGAASDTLRLNPGEHDFEVAYRSNDDGSAVLRVYWEELSFPRQTIPPSAFTSAPTPATTLGETARHGRMAFAQNHCVKCHAPEGGLGATPMPETSEIGPLLFGIGDRVSEEWLRNWLADPHTLRPTTRMPDLVDASTAEGRQQAADLAAYFSASTMGAPAQPAPDPALSQAGGAHFHELGCAGCHTPPDRTEPDLEGARVPLNNVALKYKPGALVAFLKKPDQFHPHTGMPDFMMSDEEAASIAAFLTEASTGKHTQIAIEFPEGDVARGEEVAKALACGVCHPGVPLHGAQAGPSLETIFNADWENTGCAAPPDVREVGLPVMNLNNRDRAALAEFSKFGNEPLKRDSPAEYAFRQIASLRCNACHGLDDERAIVELVQADTQRLVEHIEGLHERLDQSRPVLTYTGEMLYSTFIEKMIAGTADPRPRPWLAMRMPAFRTRAPLLAEGLVRAHGFPPSKPLPVEVDADLAKIGRSLLGADGFGCNTCHGIGEEKPTAAFEVEGINLALSPERLREGYYHRWMDNPQSIIPGTKMPRYSENNQSQRGDVLGGDAQKQFEAIWHYLHTFGTAASE
jgi:cytochrome c2